MWQPSPLDIAKFSVAEFDPLFQFEVPSEAFEIKTCQRTLFLYASSPELKAKFSLALRHYEGTDAYGFLLRFACGLESAIKGETDVFGQLKTAFKNLSIQKPELSETLRPIFLKAFEDTKEIRANFLQGIGGNTYGALARRLMDPTSRDRVLVIGAGGIAKSVAPYFADFSLTVWNRSSDRLHILASELLKKGHRPVLIQESDLLEQAIREATLVLIATPFGASVDGLVATHLSSNARVLHLGAQEKETKTLPFPSLSLTDLFDMEREQGALREKQVRQAMQACQERALLRNLSRSIVAHGWEDLAVFF